MILSNSHCMLQFYIVDTFKLYYKKILSQKVDLSFQPRISLSNAYKEMGMIATKSLAELVDMKND